MATYSRAQIEIMALGVGWGSRSKDISYVAMAESSGNSITVNSIGCVGLLQINQPVHVGSHPKWTRAWLQDPINNLTAGLVLFKGAGNKLDGPWADSKNKGDGGGWGEHVSSSSGAVQVDDDPCKYVIGPLGDACREEQNGGSVVPKVGDTAEQLGRVAQAVAKAGNWLADPGNWVRIAYVAGGGLLALTAVNVIIQPYTNRAYRQVMGALPVKTTKDVARQLRRNPSDEE